MKMRNDIKDLADAMERGWNLVPKVSPRDYFNNQAISGYGPISGIKSACAQGHALLGMNTTAINQLFVLFPVLLSQRVEATKQSKNFYADDTTWLTTAINELVGLYGWDTPKVVAWLRTHQND
jgi:hypothetical protein